MSQWTHVTATFRVDRIFGDGNIPPWECRELFGANLPCGSEGPLALFATRRVDEGDFVSCGGSVVVYAGDLRGYDNAEEVRKWFTDGIRNAQFHHWWVREAMCRIEVEFVGVTILSFDGNRTTVNFTPYENSDESEVSEAPKKTRKTVGKATKRATKSTRAVKARKTTKKGTR